LAVQCSFLSSNLVIPLKRAQQQAQQEQITWWIGLLLFATVKTKPFFDNFFTRSWASTREISRPSPLRKKYSPNKPT